MATATATPTANAYPNGIDNGQRFVYVYGTIAVSASPATYATGGLTLSFVNLTADGGFEVPVSATDIAAPVEVDIYSVAGGLFPYGWNKATGKLQIFAASAGAAGSAPYEEFPNATAIPAGVSGDTIAFKATFVKTR